MSHRACARLRRTTHGAEPQAMRLTAPTPRCSPTRLARVLCHLCRKFENCSMTRRKDAEEEALRRTSRQRISKFFDATFAMQGWNQAD